MRQGQGRTLEEKRAAATAVQVEAESRLAKIRSAPRVRETSWPGEPAFRLKMVILSRTDIAECRAAAFHYLLNELKEKTGAALAPGDTVNLDLYQDEIITQILFRALRDPEDPKQPLAPNAKDLRDTLDANTQTVLYDEYCDFLAEVDPAPEMLGPDLWKAIGDAVKKKDAERLLGFGGRRLVAYMLSTDDQPTSSPTSTSSEPSGSTTSTSS